MWLYLIDFGLWDAAGLNVLGFSKEKICILLGTVCVTKIHLVIYVWRGRNGWQRIVLDDVAIFGISKCGCIWLIYCIHGIAKSILTRLRRE
jgi:hypothetical protein